jgi:hypothetical protein
MVGLEREREGGEERERERERKRERERIAGDNCFMYDPLCNAHKAFFFKEA